MSSLAIALLSVSGCIPLPFVAPPIEASVTVAVAGGNPPPRMDWEGIGDQTGVVGVVARAGVYPAGFFENLLERRIDAGAGVLLDVDPNGALTYGGYGEFRVHPWVEYRQHTNRPTVWRSSVHLTGEVLVNDRMDIGGGGSVGISFETAHFTSGQFAEFDWYSGGVIGYGHGEAGVGIGLDTTLRVFEDAWWIGVGLRFKGRLPAALGALIIPLNF